MTKGQKVGYFFLGLLPLPIAIALQNLLMIPLGGISFALILVNGGVTEPSGEALFDMVLSQTFLEIVEVVYASAAVVLFGFWLYKVFRKEHGPLLRRERRFLLLLLGLLLLCVGGQFLAEVVYDIVGMFSPATAQNYEKLIELAGFDEPSVLTLVYGVLIGPIAEELIFRGVMMHYLRRSLPFAAANVIQAVLFGVYHMNLMQGIYTAVIGLLFGYICYRGGSILYSILAHMMFNFLGFTNLLYLGSDSPYYEFFWLPVMILALILGSMLFFRKSPETS